MAIYDRPGHENDRDHDTLTRADDDELRRLTGIDPDEERRMENDAVHDGSETGNTEHEGLKKLNSDDTKSDEKKPDSTSGSSETKDSDKDLFTGNGKKRTTRGLRARFNSSSTASKWMIGAGGGFLVSMIGSLIALILMLLPFKVTHAINQIEQRLGEVPQYAVERRVEYYMNRYLILRTIATSVGEENVNRNNYVYLGDGVFSTLYTNWRGANLEGKLAAQGWRLEASNETPAQIFNRRSIKPTDWTLINDNVSVDSPLHRQSLDSKQSRAFIKQFAVSETKSRQVFKRYNMRKMLKRYYGVNDWKIFETDRNDRRRSYLEKKLALKRTMVNQTVGRISTRYGVYLNCLLEGGNTCRAELGRGADPTAQDGGTRTETDPDTGEQRVVGGGGTDEAALTNRNGQEGLGSEAADLVDGIGDSGGSSDKIVARQISQQIQELGMKKILASFVAGIGLLETISQIVNALDSGALNIVVYDKNSQQYANFAAPVLSMADQIRSGDVHVDDARLLNEMFNNFQESPVYQNEFGSSSGELFAQDAGNGQIRRDCNNDDDITDNDDLLEPGETVCPEKRLVQDMTTFTENDGWKILSKASEAYRGSVGRIVGFFTDIVSTVTSAIGLDSLIEKAMNALGVTDLLASAFRVIMNRIAGPVLTGVEVEADAYDALYAGMAVNYSSIGGGVGATREDTTGGGYLNDAQVLSIRNEGVEERQYAKQFESIADRYLSLDNTSSLLTMALMRIPTSANQLMSSIASIPSGFAQSFGSVLGSTAGAQTMNSTNPFHAIWYGYPTDHPLFTENDGEGMNEEQLEATYRCSLPIDQRPQNQQAAYGRPDDIPFDVALEADPCLLEQVVLDVGSRAYTNTYNEGFGENSDPTNQPAVGATVPLNGYRLPGIQTDTTADRCVGGLQPGTEELGTYVGQRWSTNLGGYSCRPKSTDGSSLSIHAEGRAVDQSFDAFNPEGLRRGNEVFGWLLANAEAIGVQYVKFYKLQWSPTRGLRCVTDQSDIATHSNHIHYEVNRLAAQQGTAWFTTRTDFAPLVINQGLCP